NNIKKGLDSINNSKLNNLLNKYKNNYFYIFIYEILRSVISIFNNILHVSKLYKNNDFLDLYSNWFICTTKEAHFAAYSIVKIGCNLYDFKYYNNFGIITNDMINIIDKFIIHNRNNYQKLLNISKDNKESTLNFQLNLTNNEFS